MREHEIQDRIRIGLSEQTEGIVLRLNSGSAWGGKLVDTPEYGPVIMNPRKIALCPEGTSDLLWIGPEGQVAWIEVKDAKGKARAAQERFLALMKKLGHKAGIARSVEDAIKITKNK